MNEPSVEERVFALRCEADRLWCAAESRRMGAAAGLNERAQWELATAVAELVANAVRHAGGGTLRLALVRRPRAGVRVVVEDHGPGIADVPAALSAPVRTVEERARGRGLGVGLGSVERMMDAFGVSSGDGGGTRIEAVKFAPEGHAK